IIQVVLPAVMEMTKCMFIHRRLRNFRTKDIKWFNDEEKYLLHCWLHLIDFYLYISSLKYFTLSSSIYSSNVIKRSIAPFGVSSITRFATVCMKVWSCEVISTMPGNIWQPSLNDCMLSRSR